MQSSLFTEIVEKYFRLVIGKITEKFNGKKEEQTLLHKTMLTEEYSADLNWGATELNHSIVAADVVSLDSSLPLKKRGKLGNATGTIAKIGVKFRKSEKQITDINVMRARGADEATVVSKIFDDAPKVVKSIDVRKEIMFQQALSTGQVLVADESDNNSDNDGTGVRADFGYLTANKFKTLVAPWGNKVARPLDDLRQLFDKAKEDSNIIGFVYLTETYFNYMRKSMQSKLLTATFENQVITSLALLPIPSRRAFLEALKDEFKAEFRIVDGVFKVENHDGSTTSVRPWVLANVVGIPSEKVGRLVYGTLAEETNPVSGVAYQKSGSHILVSKYSKTDPLEEFTAGQALCMPVIDGADSIYLLEANATAAGALIVTNDDVSEGELNVAKTASTNLLTVTYKGDIDELTFESDQTWCTVSHKDGVLTVKVAANSAASAPARTATVTVTDGYNTVEIDVKQAANT
mgnify:CR=1 FL=1